MLLLMEIFIIILARKQITCYFIFIKYKLNNSTLVTLLSTERKLNYKILYLMNFMINLKLKTTFNIA